ncbi:hypothetical protein HMPREF3204_00578 [Gardnerella pickettii]|nr:hypothetical protein HMPREF3204_00578 [Gardnerella pickettii]
MICLRFSNDLSLIYQRFANDLSTIYRLSNRKFTIAILSLFP